MAKDDWMSRMSFKGSFETCHECGDIVKRGYRCFDEMGNVYCPACDSERAREYAAEEDADEIDDELFF